MKQMISVCMSLVFLFGLAAYLPSAEGETFFADGYNGSTYEGTSYETITFSTKDDNELAIYGAVPKYSFVGTNLNTCANVAGGILLGYYDKDYNELIPNFEAVRIIRDKIIFADQTSAVQDVLDELYELMETNVGGPGTTVEGFKTGLREYVEDQGRNITYNSLVSSEELDIDDYKDAINNEKPVALFVSKYTMIALTGIDTVGNSDEYTMLHYGGAHVLIGYGIREIEYYNQDGSLKEKVTLLKVATGYSIDPLVYVIIDDRMQIIDGYEVTIY